MAISQEEFERFLDSCDDNGYGRRVYSRIFGLAEKRKMSLHRTPEGFITLRETIGEQEVVLCQCYHCGFEGIGGQSIWVSFGYSDERRKTSIPDKTIEDLLDQGVATTPLERTDRGAKLLITRCFSDTELDSLVEWLELVSETFREHQAS